MSSGALSPMPRRSQVQINIHVIYRPYRYPVLLLLSKGYNRGFFKGFIVYPARGKLPVFDQLLIWPRHIWGTSPQQPLAQPPAWPTPLYCSGRKIASTFRRIALPPFYLGRIGYGSFHQSHSGGIIGFLSLQQRRQLVSPEL